MHQSNGLGSWKKEVFIAKFKHYADSNYKSEKVGMTLQNTVMPWTMYAGMTENDLAAIYAYLNSLKPNPNKVLVRRLDK